MGFVCRLYFISVSNVAIMNIGENLCGKIFWLNS